MTNRSQKEIARRQTQSKFPYLIKIFHPTLGNFYYANSDQDIIYDNHDGEGSQTYLASVFSVQPPDRDGSKIGDATLSISSVDQLWIQRIRSTQIPAKLNFIAVIVNSDLTIESLEENSFTLRQASWNETTISWTMTFDENMTISTPTEKCTAYIAPGCS